MSFCIDFQIRKPTRKPGNDNFHDDAAWEASYKIAEKFDPVDKMPHQYAVHRVYEFLNRPWQTDHQNVRDMTRWLASLRDARDEGLTVWPVLAPPS